MGGTRFVGKSLVNKLALGGHELILFTRGKQSVPAGVEHLKGDRKDDEALNQLNGRTFDVIIDSSGRNLDDTQRVINHTGIPSYRLLYVSSAGVYKSSNELPIDENYEIDPLSRHFGKVQTELWLEKEKIPFTSFRPTYIYGPGNYNPIEKWFFDRISNNRPIPLPGQGNTITQLGHVDDLAEAMLSSLEVDIARNSIYNCSSNKAVTFLGIIEAAAFACGKDPDSIDLRPFDASGLNEKSRKVFPLRLSNFFTDISRIEQELSWSPKYDLKSGFMDSYTNDYLLNDNEYVDYSIDKIVLNL